MKELDAEVEAESSDLVRVHQKIPAKTGKNEPTERTDDPVRMYLREMGSRGFLSAWAKSRSPSASRPAARP